jgi:DNA modification methylase
MGRDISELLPNEQNPRTITAKKSAALQKSLMAFGDLGGVVFNRALGGGRLVGGHQRIDAFKSSPNPQVTIERTYAKPTRTGTVAEGYVDIEGERFAYREVHWPDENLEKAANLAANKSAGEWSMPKVTDWLKDLDTAAFNTDLTMFDHTERESLLGSPSLSDVRESPPEDNVPVFEKKTKTRLGDVYVLGNHRLMCADASSKENIRVLMGGNNAQMVYTDPPYGMNLKQCNHQGIGQKRLYDPIIGDNQDFDPTLLLETFGSVAEIFLWGADYYRKLIHPGGSWIVWDKKSGADGRVINGYDGSQFELCWSKKKHSREICRLVWQGFVGLHADGGKRYHPTQKPVALTEWFFDRWGKEGDIVVDLFGGSGGSLLACENRARTCYMMELDPSYCDVVVARYEQLTGKKAELLSSGMAAGDA